MRHDDQSNPKIISHKVRCYNCQRPAQAEKKTFYGTKPGEKYRGNLPIKKETPRNSDDGKVYYVTECYTGKYIMKFGNFCSVKCGLIWANNEIERRRNHRFGQGRSLDDTAKSQLLAMKKRMTGQ